LGKGVRKERSKEEYQERKDTKEGMKEGNYGIKEGRKEGRIPLKPTGVCCRRRGNRGSIVTKRKEHRKRLYIYI
jgi:hypothetical protein